MGATVTPGNTQSTGDRHLCFSISFPPDPSPGNPRRKTAPQDHPKNAMAKGDRSKAKAKPWAPNLPRKIEGHGQRPLEFEESFKILNPKIGHPNHQQLQQSNNQKQQLKIKDPGKSAKNKTNLVFPPNGEPFFAIFTFN